LQHHNWGQQFQRFYWNTQVVLHSDLKWNSLLHHSLSS